MKRAKIVAMFTFLFMITPSCFSQKWELGLSAGLSYYVGDLNPTGHFQFPHPAGSIFVKRIIDNRWSVRANFTYLGISADDKEGVWGYQQVRNLNFQSHVFEFHSAIELNFFPFKINEPKTKKWTPYLFAGLGAYYYDPQTIINGSLVQLQPLGTEGQETDANSDRKLYSRIMPCLPFGMGVKFNIKNRVTIGMEYGMRLTFNDYLDDVSADYATNSQIVALHGAAAGEANDQSLGPDSGISNDFYQRGNKTDIDWYGYLGVSLIFYIKDPNTCNGVGVGKGDGNMKENGKRRK